MIKKIIYIFLSILLFSCNNIEKVKKNKKIESYEKIGFAGSLNDINIKDNKAEAIIDKNFSHNVIKITNLINNKSITLSNIVKKELNGSRIIYLSDIVKNSLEINSNIPYVKIESFKSNPTFVANKAKTFNEEKKVSNTSKVSSVEVISLSKKTNNVSVNKQQKNKIFLQYGSFYYNDFAKDMSKNLKKFLNSTSISVYGEKKKGYYVIIGPILNIKKFDEVFNDLKNHGYEGYEILVR